MGQYYVAQGAIVRGNVEIGNDSSIWYNAVVRADDTHIVIGSNVNVQDNCVLHADPGGELVIGDNVTIGHGAIVHGCSVGNNTLIGMGAIILNGAVVGNNCIIGAGALIPERKVIPDNSLVIGNPGRIARKVMKEDEEKILANANHYSSLAKYSL